MRSLSFGGLTLGLKRFILVLIEQVFKDAAFHTSAAKALMGF